MKIIVNTETKLFYDDQNNPIEYSALQKGDELCLPNNPKIIKTIGKRGRPTLQWSAAALVFTLTKTLHNKAEKEVILQSSGKKRQIGLFLDLAKPNSEGVSRIVFLKEFTGIYESLFFSNGRPWCRDDGTLGKMFNIGVIKNDPLTPYYDKDTSATKIIGIKLDGYYTDADKGFTNQIDQKIKKIISKQRCVMTASSHKIEVDHKNGRKNEARVMEGSKQTIDDFQPLSRNQNLAKRSVCKKCNETNIRFDASKIGYCVSVVCGKLEYEETVGCKGCYWHDPIFFRGQFVLKPKEVNNEDSQCI